jgi:hypothetical protein
MKTLERRPGEGRVEHLAGAAHMVQQRLKDKRLGTAKH